MTRNQARLIDIVLYVGIFGSLLILLRDNPANQGLLVVIISIYGLIQYFRYSKYKLPIEKPVTLFLLSVQFFIAFAVQTIDGTFLPQLFFFILIAEIAYRIRWEISLTFAFISYFSYIFAVAMHFNFPPFYEISYVIPRFIEYILFWGFSFVAKHAVDQKEQLSLANKELKKAAKDLEERTLLQERMRLSREIHDTVGHTLTTSLVGIETAKYIINKGNITQGLDQLEKSINHIKGSIEDVRAIVHTMYENGLIRDNLLKIIKETEEQSQITIVYDIDENLPTLNPAQELALFRSLQEGLTNGIRHGQSMYFDYQLKVKRDGLYIILEDRGDFKETSPYGFGLKGMENRFSMLGGSIALSKNKYGGCTINGFLPLAFTGLRNQVTRVGGLHV